LNSPWSETEQVKEAMLAAVASDPPLLSEVARHVIESGGKLLRGTLVTTAYGALGGEDLEEVVPLAAAIELIHGATLLHDDIIDGASLRRGREAAHSAFSLGGALVGGDFLYVKAFEISGRYGPRVIEITGAACTALAEGETLQQLNRSNFELDESTYFKIIEKKTAALITAGVLVGGHLAGATEEQMEALRDYGTNLGLAFQITDDLLDIMGREEVLGKSPFTDLHQGNLTLAAIHALAHSPEAPRLLEILNTSDWNGKLEGVARNIMREASSLEYAKRRAKEFADRASKALDILPPSNHRDVLSFAADSAVTRQS